MRRGALEGDMETGMMIGGQGIGRIKEVSATALRASRKLPKISSATFNCSLSSAGVACERGSILSFNVCTSVLPSMVSLS